MSDHVAQRTLVKSTPELWSEVSEPLALAGRLEAFGEIRITRIEPESSVAWEGRDVSGTVELEPTGWGTRVTLRAALAEAPEAPAPPVAPAPEPPAEPEPEPVVTPLRPPEPEPEPEPAGEPEPEPLPPAAAEPAAVRRGVFARLFGRRRRAAAAGTPVAAAPVDVPVDADDGPSGIEEEAPSPVVAPQPVVATPEPPPAAAAIAAPLDARVPEILAAILDDLGSAHHRPYSRG